MEKKSERIATAVEVRCRWDIWQARWDQEVLKLKERKIKVFFIFIKNKVHHLVIRGTHFEQNENNPMKKLYLIHQV